MKLEKEHGFDGGKYSINDLIPVENFYNIVPEPINYKFAIDPNYDHGGTGLTYDMLSLTHITPTNIYLASGINTTTAYLKKFDIQGNYVGEVTLDTAQTSKATIIRSIRITSTNIICYLNNISSGINVIRVYDLSGNVIKTTDIHTPIVIATLYYNDSRIFVVGYDYNSRSLIAYVLNFEGTILYSCTFPGTFDEGADLAFIFLRSDNIPFLILRNGTIVTFTSDLESYTTRVEPSLTSDLTNGPGGGSLITHGDHIYISCQPSATSFFKFDYDFTFIERIAINDSGPHFQLYANLFLCMSPSNGVSFNLIKDRRIYCMQEILPPKPAGYSIANYTLADDIYWFTIAANNLVYFYNFKKIQYKIKS